MKKLICIVLAVLSVVGLCACNSQGPVNSAGVVMATEKPTDEERDIIADFYFAVKKLESGADESEAAEIYLQLQQMDEYDKYIGTEYASCQYLERTSGKLFTTSYDREISSWDRHEILSRFTVVGEKLTKIQRKGIDNLGNESGPYDHMEVQYYEDGSIKSYSDDTCLSCIDIENMYSVLEHDNGQREYDEAGRLAKVTFYQYDNIKMVQTYTYDAAGALTRMVAKNNYAEYVYNYTCDSQNRVTKITWTEGEENVYEVTYTYDAQGNLTEEAKSVNRRDLPVQRERFSHTYDANGKRTESVYVNERYECAKWFSNTVVASDYYVQKRRTDTYTYEYDDQGKLIQVVKQVGTAYTYKTDGTVSNESEPREPEEVYQLVYGTYCIYQAQEPEN